MTPSVRSVRRSSASGARACGPSSPAPTSYTASGCVARADASTFAAMGVAAFAARAGGEQLATGEHARRRSDESRDELTAQQRQIAELARDGLSNAEIGARLFLSRRTVEWHLRHVYVKLAIKSR